MMLTIEPILAYSKNGEINMKPCPPMAWRNGWQHRHLAGALYFNHLSFNSGVCSRKMAPNFLHSPATQRPEHNQPTKKIMKTRTKNKQLIQRCVLTGACLITTALTPEVLGQGALTPPGAPAPTMKTLDQLDAKLEQRTPISSLPYTISSAGSYHLTTNLTTALMINGITVLASHVTIDLRGFAIIGAGQSGGGPTPSPCQDRWWT